MQDTSSLNSLQSELEQGSTALPSIDVNALMPLMITSIAITVLLTILFLIYVSFNTIRRYKVEKATLEMQKDIRRMRELMEQGSTALPDSPHATIPRDLIAHRASELDTPNPADDREITAIESQRESRDA